MHTAPVINYTTWKYCLSHPTQLTVG